MTILNLDIPPGVYSHGTPLESKGRWIDANYVRWTNGVPHPVGGWVNLRSSGADVQVDTSTEGIFRGAHAWQDNSGSPYFAFGSASKLYVMLGTNLTYDITPAGFTTGIAVAAENLGYGGKAYGAGAYGVSREADYSVADATNWTLDNWGEFLVGCSDADGNIYEWQLGTGTPAAALSGAPTGNSSIIVTAERFVFAFGAGGNPRKVQWCDREDNTTWTPAITNEAGDIELQTTGRIVAAERVRGRTLILTSEDAWVATYQGPPTVYGFQKVGSSCGLVSRNMSAAVGPMAFWMGERDFYMYDGSSARVLPCEVHDKVFTEMNTDRISHGYCVTNQKFGEVWWFYPGEGASENTRYVVYDYQDNHWMVGTLDRTAGVDDSGVFTNPLMIDGSGFVYRHEAGYVHGGTKPYLTSGPVNIADGETVVRVTQLIPEEETQGQMALSFTTKFYPNGTEYSHGPYNPANPTDVRFTGRQFSMRIDADDGVDWRFGNIRLRIAGGGRR